MLEYLARRTLRILPTVFVVVSLVFLLVHLVPGDPVELMLGDKATEFEKNNLRTLLRLDLPLSQQYAEFLSHVIQGDLGQDVFTRTPVLQELLNRFPYTLMLSLAALFVSCCVSFPLGIMAALKRGRVSDVSASFLSLMFMSVPTFWLGPLLIIVFSIHFNLTPVSGAEYWGSIILPALTLGLPLSAFLTRMIRASMLEVLEMDYVRVAHAKGLTYSVVILKHVLRNALIPVITVLGTQFGTLMAGAVITESIFDWPGIGLYFFRGFQQRNYPVIQGCVLFISLSTILINLLVDVMYRAVDPRVELK